MKRRLIGISLTTLTVLGGLGAGSYAYWGKKKTADTPTPPAVDIDSMSKQIAAANLKPPTENDGGYVRPAVALEESPASESRYASPSNTFKPRANGLNRPPVTPPVEEATPIEAPPKTGPRYSYGNPPATTPPDSPEATDATPVEIENNAAPMPRKFAGADTESTEETTPIAPPPRSFGSRFPANATTPPANELPAETTPVDVAEETLPKTAPPRRTFGDSRPIVDNVRPMHTETENSIASARPGEKSFEGTQQPSLVIEKLAPPEIQVGKPAQFEIHVKNAGQAAAQNVVITDRVPQGTKLVDAKPQPEQGADGTLVWNLGKLDAGANQTITLELMPLEEGEIGSVAQVTFVAAASVKTVCTKPMLAVEQVAPAKAMIGETVTVQITITNPGTGVATNVVLQEDVPEGFSHAAGKELEYEVGTLRPGESRKLELQLQAAKAGQIVNTLSVKGDANLLAQHSAKVEVVAPQLEVAMNGPKRRYLDRQATYTVSIANPGTATARDVEVVAYLPKGMKFVSTDHEGQYDAAHHAVHWSLEELPASQKGTAQLVAIPFEAGEQKLRVEGRAQLNLQSSDEESVLVEAISNLVFEIIDEHDPIEVGADTMYQVRVKNEGSKAATNVQVAAQLPPELRPSSAEGATRGTVKGQTVVFESLGKLAPQAEATFKIKATGLQTGDYTIRVQVSSDDSPTPVTKEEPTRVYADR